MKKTRLKIKVLTGKPKFKVKELGELVLIEIKNNPEKGKANKEIIKEMKKIFGNVKLISGLKSKEKIIEISSSQEEVEKQLSLVLEK